MGKQVENRFSNISVASLLEQEKESIVDLALKVLSKSFYEGEVIDNAQSAEKFLRLKLSSYKREVFSVIFLDNRHRVLGYEELFKGTINGCTVHPRIVVQISLEMNAAAIIMAHNHPSQNPEPSESDRLITSKMVEALTLVDVRVLDHLVIGCKDYVSFADRGLL